MEDVSYQRDFDFFFPSQARSSLTAQITDIIAIGMAAIWGINELAAYLERRKKKLKSRR